MSGLDLNSQTNEQLVDMFADISRKLASELDVDDDGSAYNHSYKKLLAVKAILRARGPEARRALLPLLDYSKSPKPWGEAQNAWVRYNAAHELLAVEPDRAYATLEALASSAPSYQRFKAKLTLDRLAEGFFKPT